jgi:hypothetical protein
VSSNTKQFADASNLLDESTLAFVREFSEPQAIGLTTGIPSAAYSSDGVSSAQVCNNICYIKLAVITIFVLAFIAIMIAGVFVSASAIGIALTAVCAALVVIFSFGYRGYR